MSKQRSTFPFVAAATLVIFSCAAVTASCGGSDAGGAGGAGAASGGGGHAPTGSHATSSTGHPAGSGGAIASTGRGGGGSGGASSTGPGGAGGAAGGTGSSSAGTGGGIDTGALDCTAPSGALGPLTLTGFVTSGLSAPVDFQPAPGDPSRLFVVESIGHLRLIKDGALQTTPFLDISAVVDFDEQERGFLAVAFHPQYQQNGRFFVYYSNVNDGRMKVVEYARSAGNADVADPTPVKTLLDQADSEPNHNGGTLTFSPLDHFLYVSWGDGGNSDDAHSGTNDTSACGNGQNKQTLLGKILRIDVDHVAGGTNYVPEGVVAGALPEIWAFGLRNPWRMAFDGCTSDLWIGDVGQATHEEIDHETAGQGGKNYGWRCLEGDEATEVALNVGCPCDPNGFTAPVVSLLRTTAQTIIGGYVYRGTEIPALRGMYLFADLGVRKIWVLDPADSYAFQADGNGNHAFGDGMLGQPVSFGQDLDGELYVVDRSGGVFKVVPGP